MKCLSLLSKFYPLVCSRLAPTLIFNHIDHVNKPRQPLFLFPTRTTDHDQESLFPTPTYETIRLSFPAEVEKHIGLRECAEWSRKAELCHRLAAGRPCVLVEDDREEIAKARKAKLGTCFVERRQGIGEKEIAELLAWASGAQNVKSCCGRLCLCVIY